MQIKHTRLSVAKKFLALTVLAAACLVAKAAGPATRIEGTYHAVYECANTTGGLDATASGTVVYYVDGDGKVDYKIYADSVSGTFQGKTIDKETLAIKALNGFWPTPLNTANADSVLSDTETELILSYDVAARVNSDDEKLMRMTGNSSKIKTWTITCAYAPTHEATVSTDSLRAIGLNLDITATGANFRRLFDANSTECHVSITIDITDVATLDPKQAKAARKADKKRFTDSLD